MKYIPKLTALLRKLLLEKVAKWESQEAIISEHIHYNTKHTIITITIYGKTCQRSNNEEGIKELKEFIENNSYDTE